MQNIFKKLIADKKEYRQMMARVSALPEEYRFVYRNIQRYMWTFASGNGRDMQELQYDLIDLLEDGAADGKNILAVTGTDVAAFCDALLQNVKKHTDQQRNALNRKVLHQLGEQRGSL